MVMPSVGCAVSMVVGIAVAHIRQMTDLAVRKVR
jgi:hypothetical protein